jgi:hypothetical protein
VRLATLSQCFHSEAAQGTFDYLLATGIFVVALVAALFAFDTIVVDIVGHVCPSVDTANSISAVGDCLSP